MLHRITHFLSTVSEICEDLLMNYSSVSISLELPADVLFKLTLLWVRGVPGMRKGEAAGYIWKI